VCSLPLTPISTTSKLDVLIKIHDTFTRGTSIDLGCTHPSPSSERWCRRGKAVEPCQFCPLVFGLPHFARFNPFNSHFPAPSPPVEVSPECQKPQLTTMVIVQEFLVPVYRDIKLLPHIVNCTTVYEASYSFLPSTPFVSENFPGGEHRHVSLIPAESTQDPSG